MANDLFIFIFNGIKHKKWENIKYMNILDYILVFFIYSYIGWMCEVIYCRNGKKAVNRGFVFGPVCPIYGAGLLILLLYLNNINYNPLIVLISGILFPTILEYITSFVMEKLFKQKWWDYSNYKFNLNGRICLLNSLLFGMLAVVAIYVVHPLVLKFLNLLNNTQKLIIDISLVTFFVLDLVFTTIQLVNFKKKGREKFKTHFYESFPYTKKNKYF